MENVKKEIVVICTESVCTSIYGFWLPLWYLQTLLYTCNFIKIISFLKNIKIYLFQDQDQGK